MSTAARRLDQAFFAWTVAVVALALAAPVAAALDPSVGRGFMAALGGLCHQMAHRSFSVLEHPMGLCARCVGVYGAMTVTWMALRRREAVWGAGRAWTGRTVLLSFGLMTLMALEWSLGHQRPWLSVDVTRFLSGAAFGAGWVLGPHRWLLAIMIQGRSLLRLSV